MTTDIQTTLTPPEVITTTLVIGQGPAGVGGGKHYAHTQASASTVWTVNHLLNKRPAISVIDSEGASVEGSLVYVSSNQLTIEFSVAISGVAYCN